MATNIRFSDAFKALWEPTSKLRSLWDALEVLYDGLGERALSLGGRQIACRSLKDIETDMQSAAKPIEVLYLEWVQILLSRLLLRVELKVRDSLQILFHSCNTANAYGCALTARALIEHVALLQFFIDRIPGGKGDPLPKKGWIEFTKELQNLTMGSRFNWDRFHEGNIQEMITSGNWQRPKNEQIPPSGTLLHTLDKSLFDAGHLNVPGEMRFLYGILCDVVHPSWGGDFIYPPRLYSDAGLVQCLDEHFKFIATVLCPCACGLVRHLISQEDHLRSLKLLVIT